MYIVIDGFSFQGIGFEAYGDSSLPNASLPLSFCEYEHTFGICPIPQVFGKQAELVDCARSAGISPSSFDTFLSFQIKNCGRKQPALASIPMDEFLLLAQAIRDRFDVNLRFPILSFASTSPIRLEHSLRSKSIPFVAHSSARMSASAELAKVARAKELRGLELFRCSVEPYPEERYELAVTGFGTVKANDEEIAGYLLDRFGPTVDKQMRTRCPQCKHFPIRADLRNAPFAVSSDFDFFRLDDFRGTYVSEKGKALLDMVSDHSLSFLPVTIGQSTE